MAIPEPLCHFLMFGAELIPYVDELDPVLSILAIVGAYAIVLFEAYPVPSAFAGGYQVGKHPLFFAVVLYIIVSIAIVAGMLPVCEGVVTEAANGAGNSTAVLP